MALRQLGDVVRFYPHGAPAVRIQSLQSGDPINIIRRQIDREPKILAPDLCDLAPDLCDVLGTEELAGTFSTAEPSQGA